MMVTAALLTGNRAVTIQEALDRSLEDLRTGDASVEDCLRRFPEYAVELRPLLNTAVRLASTNDVRASRAYKARLRNELMGVDRPESRRLPANRLAVWFVVIIVALVALIALALATGFLDGGAPLAPLTDTTRSLALQALAILN
jgi:hypothetical protein